MGKGSLMSSKLSSDSSLLLQLDSTQASLTNKDDFKKQMTKRKMSNIDEEDEEMNEGENAADAPIQNNYISSLNSCFSNSSPILDFSSSRESSDPLLRDSSANPMCLTLDQYIDYHNQFINQLKNPDQFNQ